MDFITENPVTRRKEELAEQERAARIAQQNQMTFRNQQEDRNRVQAADQATRDYLSASFRDQPEPRTPIPAIGPIANPDQQRVTAATPGFNPDAPGPQPTQVSMEKPASRAQPTAVNVPVNNRGSRDMAFEKLLQTPGTGQFAQAEMQRRQAAAEAQAREQDEAEATAIEALASGDMVTYQYWSKKANLSLPEGMIRTAEDAQRTGQGMKVAEKLYGEDPAAAQKFLVAYMQNGGDLTGAIQVAGVPRGKENWTMVDLVQDGQTVLARFNTDTGAIDIPTQGGQPYVTKPTGSQDRPTALMQNVSFLVDKGIAPTHEAAFTLLNSAKTDPLKRAQLVAETYSSLVEENQFSAEPKTPAELQQEAEQFIDRLIQGAQPTLPQGTPVEQQGQYLPAPRDPAQRTVGQTYNTPQGPLIWQGQGWQRPQTSN